MKLALLLAAILSALALAATSARSDQRVVYREKAAMGCVGDCVERSKLVAVQKLAHHRLRLIRRYKLERNAAAARNFSSVEYALRLAAVVYGVPYGQLSSVSWCESHHRVFARNGQYRSLFQEGPMFERGPFGRAGFSVWDPIANAMTAGYTVSREGWRQWSCQP